MPADTDIRLSVEATLRRLQSWTDNIALLLIFGLLLAVLLVRRRSRAFERLRDLLECVPRGPVPDMLMFATLLGATGGLIEGLITLYKVWIVDEPVIDVASLEVLWMAPLAASVSIRNIPATIADFVSDGDMQFPGRSLLDADAGDANVISTLDQFGGFGDVPVARGDMASLISQGLHLSTLPLRFTPLRATPPAAAARRAIGCRRSR